MRRIGVLVPGTEEDSQLRDRIKSFEQGLEKLGWIDGRNLRIEYRWAGTDQQRLRSAAAELVSANPEVILAPTVFVSMYDPVGSGFVTNLARPDGNLTGFALGELTLGGKMLERLKEVASKIDHVTVVLKRCCTQSRLSRPRLGSV